MDHDGAPVDQTNRHHHDSKSEPSVYTISGLYSQALASDDSEVTESTYTSTSEFPRVSERPEPHPYTICPTTTEDTCDTRNCGICSLRPRFLQRFANIKVFVLLCCVLVTLQQTLSSGYLNSVITTIEKRFDITSGLSGAIASTYEIGNLITIIFVSYLGSRRHIPIWLAIGVIVMGIGSIVFVLPQFITERYTVQTHISRNNTQDHICRTASLQEHARSPFLSSPAGGEPGSHHCVDGQSSNTLVVVIFMVAQLLIGCGGSPLFTLGTTYIDDHVKRESAAVYIGCLYSMVAFGPVCGFLLGGYLLSFYVDSFSYDSEELNINPSDPRWVGAWWGGFLIIGCLLLVVSVPVFAFPKRLRHVKRQVLLVHHDKGTSPNNPPSVPATNVILPSQAAEDGERTKAEEREYGDYGKSIRDIPRSMLSLLYNPVYIVTCMGSCMELIIVSGFVVFLPKYLETQFSIGKSQANVFTGGIAIPGACVGIFMGGYIVKRFQLRPKGAVQFVLLSNLVCLVIYCLLFFLGCDNVKMAGATMPYNNSTLIADKFQVNLTAMCNMGCECSPNNIAPICGSNGLTYFSPCHAGCTTRTPADGQQFGQDYSDCKCISNNQSYADYHEVMIVPVAATTGPCAHFCYTISPFMVLLFLMSLAVSITQMPLLMIVLRSVEEHERSFALGMQFVIFRLFGYIPSPIVFGNMIDSTCLLWKATCTSNGFCLMYDIEKFRYKYVGICAGIKVVAASIFLVDWILIRQCYDRNKAFTMTVRDMVTSVASLDKVACQDVDSGEDFVASSQPPTPSIRSKTSHVPLQQFSKTVAESTSEAAAGTHVSYESSI